MIFRGRILKLNSQLKFKPRYSSETTTTPKVESSIGSNFSSFIQRISSFLVGTSFGFGINFYLIHEELSESNKKFEKTLQDFDGRIQRLEKR